MKKTLAAALVALVLTASTAFAQLPPGRYEAEVAAYEAADRQSPPPSGEILFVGSSSIATWNLQRWFPDLKTVNRGINGSWLSDAVRLADRLVIPYQPRLIVLYAGDNDIWGGATSEQVAILFEQFVRTVRGKLPDVRIVFIGIKPSLQRWSVIERVRAANAMIRAYAEHDDRVAFVDTDQAMLGWTESPRPELFIRDGLHLTDEGYQVWTLLLRPLLAGH